MEVNLFHVPLIPNDGAQNAQNLLHSSGLVPAANIGIVRSIPRSNLPLSWLDTSSSTNQRIFTSNNHALELPFADTQHAPIVLLAQDKISSKYCAVEKVDKGTYALCWIGTWVNESLITLIAQPSLVPRPNIKRSHDAALDDKWWSKAALPETVTKLRHPASEWIKLDMSRPPVLSSSPPSLQEQLLPAQVGPNQPISDLTATIVLNKDQLFENLVTQYLETLYLNKTSLAFFAKGPLSRIKSSFTASNDLSIFHLTIFLRSMILTSNSMDKKFKTKLPELASSFALNASDDDEIATEKKTKRKSTKKRKLKLNSDGMYSFELEYVQKWWRSDEESHPNSEETGKQRIERRSRGLRIRETLIQIMLILEVIALEAMPEWNQAEQLYSETVAQAEEQPKKRTKKPLDLSKHLDHNIDMLLIWHTVGFGSDALIISPEKQNKKGWDKDRLGSFCVEVIIPFYKNRLPKLASQIAKKFGGPNQSPDKRRKIEKRPENSNPKEKEETAAHPKKPVSKPLQRTASMSMSTSSQTRPGLSRASTDSGALHPFIKREGSETPSLSSFPLLSQEKRKPKAPLKHLQARQVSMSALATTSSNLSKRKRDAAQDDEIKNAINFIKRPNRSAAGRDLADEREKRVVPSQKAKAKPGSARKVLKSVENVQVMATPHAGRRVDVFSQPLPSIALGDPSPEPPSSWRITSSNPSTVKAAKASRGGAVAETPCKDMSRSQPTATIFASPEVIRRAKVAVVSSSSATLVPPPRFRVAETSVVQSTPVRPTSRLIGEIGDVVAPQTPVQSAKKATAIKGTPNIYDDLGWDKYDIDD